MFLGMFKSNTLESNKMESFIPTIIKNEIKELNRRAAEMENDPSVCIPHERVYEMVMMRIQK